MVLSQLFTSDHKTSISILGNVCIKLNNSKLAGANLPAIWAILLLLSLKGNEKSCPSQVLQVSSMIVSSDAKQSTLLAQIQQNGHLGIRFKNSWSPRPFNINWWAQPLMVNTKHSQTTKNTKGTHVSSLGTQPTPIISSTVKISELLLILTIPTGGSFYVVDLSTNSFCRLHLSESWK